MASTFWPGSRNTVTYAGSTLVILGHKFADPSGMIRFAYAGSRLEVVAPTRSSRVEGRT